jgi:catechol 2,3-dioxygenase-like lactoylglutathione lyase family enzyme
LPGLPRCRRFPTNTPTGYIGAMTAPLPIQAVNHVAVTTRNVERSRAFYRDVLGFREVARPAFDFDGAWLFNYGLMIHIIANHAAAPADGDGIRTRDNHLALHTDDMQLAERLLREHSIAFRKNEIVDRGIKQIFFRDPDGHHIEIGTYPPTPPFV